MSNIQKMDYVPFHIRADHVKTVNNMYADNYSQSWLSKNITQTESDNLLALSSSPLNHIWLRESRSVNQRRQCERLHNINISHPLVIIPASISLFSLSLCFPWTHSQTNIVLCYFCLCCGHLFAVVVQRFDSGALWSVLCLCRVLTVRSAVCAQEECDLWNAGTRPQSAGRPLALNVPDRPGPGRTVYVTDWLSERGF